MGRVWVCMVSCGMFTKGGPSFLTVNRLRDPDVMTPHPTMSINYEEEK